MTEVVFVHGAFVRDGAWWWQHTAELLERDAGMRSRAVLLPSCGEAPSPDDVDGLAADAAALRAVLDAVDDAVVVAHSYGGTVVAEAGTHPSIRALLLISSYLPEAGLSQAGIMRDEPDGVVVRPYGDRDLVIDGYDAESFGRRFLQDADLDTQREGWARVVPQHATAFTTATTAAGWRDVDSTYVVCTDDRSTSIGLQLRHAARATRGVELDTGHHPFITRPDLVVEQVLRLAG